MPLHYNIVMKYYIQMGAIQQGLLVKEPIYYAMI